MYSSKFKILIMQNKLIKENFNSCSFQTLILLLSLSKCTLIIYVKIKKKIIIIIIKNKK